MENITKTLTTHAFSQKLKIGLVDEESVVIFGNQKSGYHITFKVSSQLCSFRTLYSRDVKCFREIRSAANQLHRLGIAKFTYVKDSTKLEHIHETM